MNQSGKKLHGGFGSHNILDCILYFLGYIIGYYGTILYFMSLAIKLNFSIVSYTNMVLIGFQEFFSCRI